MLSISHQDGSGPFASVPEAASCGLWAERGVVRERQRQGALGGDKPGKGVGKVVRDAARTAEGKHIESEDVFKLSYLRHNELEYVPPRQTTNASAEHSFPSWSPDPQPDVMTLRSLQLDIRVHELYATYRSFRTLLTSSASSLPGLAVTADTIHHTSAPAVEWLETLFPRGSVDTDAVDLVGHSFGGGTMVWALERGVPEGEEALPVRKAVALDPWYVVRDPSSRRKTLIRVNPGSIRYRFPLPSRKSRTPPRSLSSRSTVPASRSGPRTLRASSASYVPPGDRSSHCSARATKRFRISRSFGRRRVLR